MTIKKNVEGKYVDEKISGQGKIETDYTLSKLIDVLIAKGHISLLDLNP